VKDNFIYRFNWGLGSIIALASDEAFGNKQIEPLLTNWPLIGLPWIALWLKELLTWGTTDPVAAYLLANKMAVTRAEAEKVAGDYYLDQAHIQDLNEHLNAGTIRDWVQQKFNTNRKLERLAPPLKMKVHLLRQKDFIRVKNTKWRVLPVEMDHDLYWYDPAGFPLAYCTMPSAWRGSFINTYDFILDSKMAVVTSGFYTEREVILE